MVNKHFTVTELIEQLQLLPDKSKWVYVQSSGHVTGVDDCPEYDDPEDLEFKEHVLRCTRSFDAPIFDCFAKDGQLLKYETFKTDLYSVRLCNVDHIPLSQQTWYKRSNTLVLAEYFSLRSRRLSNVYVNDKELQDVFQDRYDRLQKSIKHFYGNSHKL